MGKRVTTYERIMQDRIIQGLLDDIRNEVPPEVALRGNAKTNPHRARVAEFFKAHGFPNAYATSFWMAFAQGISIQGLQGSAGSGGVSAWSRKITTYTAVTGDRLIADTSGGAFTITLPATPTTGNSVIFADGADWFTTNLTVARNGSTIEGVADDFVLDIKGITVEFVYDGTTWEVFASTGPAGPNDVILAQNDTSTTTLYPVMVSSAGVNATPKVTTTTNYLSFNAATGQITAIDFNSASDQSIKTNVSKLNNSIEILKTLSPVSFNWTNSNEKSYGLIAQEVEKILPELVSETNDIKSVRYIPLIAMLIDAVVDLEKRITNE